MPPNIGRKDDRVSRSVVPPPSSNVRERIQLLPPEKRKEVGEVEVKPESTPRDDRKDDRTRRSQEQRTTRLSKEPEVKSRDQPFRENRHEDYRRNDELRRDDTRGQLERHSTHHSKVESRGGKDKLPASVLSVKRSAEPYSETQNKRYKAEHELQDQEGGTDLLAVERAKVRASIEMKKAERTRVPADASVRHDTGSRSSNSTANRSSDRRSDQRDGRRLESRDRERDRDTRREQSASYSRHSQNNVPQRNDDRSDTRNRNDHGRGSRYGRR